MTLDLTLTSPWMYSFLLVLGKSTTSQVSPSLFLNRLEYGLGPMTDPDLDDQ